eukprot:TRINITY_DN376_c0_g1_i1.p1 TRINITY_DN376_c0_g1~~TRINITY_DN376_c0_g1_i1.p1  ORF type:complete len:381 (-),score=67.21 TRINITY_DN376_c0_g1_i1:527-1558(-)
MCIRDSINAEYGGRHLRMRCVTMSAWPVKGVIFDLDGTLLDTETGIHRITYDICKEYGKEYDPALGIGMGRRPREAVADVIEHLGLPLSVDQYMEISSPRCMASFERVDPLVGAERLVTHLHQHGIPIAIATSSYRDAYEKKVASHPWFDWFGDNVITGDEVTQGKPHPEIFVRAAAMLGLDPQECLVIEDAPSGVQAAVDAGTQVVAVACAMLAPTMYAPLNPNKIYQSLLEFEPELFGLPEMQDTIHGTVPRLPTMSLQSLVLRAACCVLSCAGCEGVRTRLQRTRSADSQHANRPFDIRASELHHVWYILWLGSGGWRGGAQDGDFDWLEPVLPQPKEDR